MILRCSCIVVLRGLFRMLDGLLVWCRCNCWGRFSPVALSMLSRWSCCLCEASNERKASSLLNPLLALKFMIWILGAGIVRPPAWTRNPNYNKYKVTHKFSRMILSKLTSREFVTMIADSEGVIVLVFASSSRVLSGVDGHLVETVTKTTNYIASVVVTYAGTTEISN